MLFCRSCNVHIDGDKKRCPLCQGELTGTPEQEMYPVYPEPRFSSNFLLKLISFIAISAMVVCAGTDFAINDRLTWSVISAGGIVCAWLAASVGVTYRKRVLKSITWELFLVTALAIIWDKCTGWYGWSLNFVLPCACICAMLSVFILSRALKMKSGQYLLYLIIGGIYGLLPMLCMLTGLVTIKFPSIICTGISIIFFAALIIFKWRSTKAEIERRFHV